MDLDSSLSDTQTPCSGNELESQEKRDPQIPWGKLYATVISLKPVELSKPSFILGRAENADVMLSSQNFPSSLLRIVSKNHFMITRIAGQNIVSITDLSKNGTYINESLIGKGNSVILQNDDEISIGTSKNRIYVYKTIQSEEDSYLPPLLKCKYELSRLIGNGAFGEVRLLFEKTTCQKFAIKKVIKKLENEKDPNSQRIQAEIDILKRLSHPFIISVKEIAEADNAVFIVLEYMEGGELTDYINCSKPLQEETVKFIFFQICLGVQYLHKQGVTHRDLKPENVLLKTNDPSNSLVKITDFGLSKIISQNILMATVCGTSYYIAPEIIDWKCKNYTQQVDVWSLGVILFYMLSQELPFRAKNQGGLFQLILSGQYTMDEEKWKCITEEAQDLVRKMLNRNHETRVTIDEVVDHSWIIEDESITQKMKELRQNGLIPNKKLCRDVQIRI